MCKYLTTMINYWFFYYSIFALPPSGETHPHMTLLAEWMIYNLGCNLRENDRRALYIYISGYQKELCKTDLTHSNSIDKNINLFVDILAFEVVVVFDLIFQQIKGSMLSQHFCCHGRETVSPFLTEVDSICIFFGPVHSVKSHWVLIESTVNPNDIQKTCLKHWPQRPAFGQTKVSALVPPQYR